MSKISYCAPTSEGTNDERKSENKYKWSKDILSKPSGDASLNFTFISLILTANAQLDMVDMFGRKQKCSK